MARMFGTDGVRGKANAELTPELAYKLGRAAAIYFTKKNGESATIFIGRDTRLSGPMYEAALTAGICSAGGHAVILGELPTPAVAFLARKHEADAGIVISASHNPFHDNGIKFFGGDGYKLPDAVEDKIEALVHRIEENDDLYRPTDEKIGYLTYRHDLLEEYISFVVGTTDIELEGMKIVLDCANGAAYEAMPRILRRLGADVIVINDKPNGVNINDNCGSTHLEMLQKAVVENKADIGIAHDGDADRCLCIDENGQFIDGDHMIAACAIYMMGKGTLKNNTVVTTVMANIGFHKAIKENGGRTEITAVGDRYVLENMLANNYNLGGEQSGHIIFTDFSTTGDGPVTALQVLSYLKRTRRKASAITNIMTSYPQLLVNVKVATKEGWEDNGNIKLAIKEGEKQLGENGRILVRPSGTEPLIRVMAEGPDQQELEEICQKIADVVKKEQG
ncbi:phosphoglucosamine mutase [Megamonas hypermegale]|uniref:Phosphoglucosamine mutase n=1 Tax=Megamonas hypermegale TaxID=158847 RepID=A0A921HKP5_9FIRM|nr:phosphoglucosamine mutase [Megamonas hypermegale]HJF84215.1 phosphoglucosamine mutase [Megamonas hypermegale]